SELGLISQKEENVSRLDDCGISPSRPSVIQSTLSVPAATEKSHPLRLSDSPNRWSASNTKVSALETVRFFEDRKARANFKAFDRIMKRTTGQPPRPGDELPKPPKRAKR